MLTAPGTEAAGFHTPDRLNTVCQDYFNREGVWVFFSSYLKTLPFWARDLVSGILWCCPRPVLYRRNPSPRQFLERWSQRYLPPSPFCKIGTQVVTNRVSSSLNKHLLFPERTPTHNVKSLCTHIPSKSKSSDGNKQSPASVNACRYFTPYSDGIKKNVKNLLGIKIWSTFQCWEQQFFSGTQSFFGIQSAP